MADEEKQKLRTDHFDQEIVEAIVTKNLGKLRGSLSTKFKLLKPVRNPQGAYNSEDPNYLHYTASLGDEYLSVLVLLMERYSSNFNFEEELTARGFLLHLAAESKAKKMIEYLLSYEEFKGKIDRMVSSYSSITALGLTVECRDFESFKLLIQNGADLNLIDHVGRSVLDYALETYRVNKETSILWQLLELTGITSVSR
jgi:hypothetical protein